MLNVMLYNINVQNNTLNILRFISFILTPGLPTYEMKRTSLLHQDFENMRFPGNYVK